MVNTYRRYRGAQFIFRVTLAKRRPSVSGNFIEILPLLVERKRADKHYIPTATRPVWSKVRTSYVEVMSVRLSVSCYLRITAGQFIKLSIQDTAFTCPTNWCTLHLNLLGTSYFQTYQSLIKPGLCKAVDGFFHLPHKLSIFCWNSTLEACTGSYRFRPSTIWIQNNFKITAAHKTTQRLVHVGHSADIVETQCGIVSPIFISLNQFWRNVNKFQKTAVGNFYFLIVIVRSVQWDTLPCIKPTRAQLRCV